jgi:acetyl-CoA C-acetyltransferase
MSRAKAEELGLEWLAEIGSWGQVAGPDSSLQSQPARAITKACKKEGISPSDLDLVEINEAFASVVLKFQKDLNIPDEKLNVNGGAIAMGHPLGATGAMITGTVVDELERRGGRYGLITLCIGGGMGVATIIERV